MYKSLPETPDTQTRQRAARGRESVFFFLISRPAAISTRSNFPVHNQKKTSLLEISHRRRSRAVTENTETRKCDKCALLPLRGVRGYSL